MRDIVYEVTAHVGAPDIKAEYLEWLGAGHVQAVLEGGADNAFVTVYEEGDGWAIESRYCFASEKELDAYEAGPAEHLRAEGQARFGDTIRFDRKVGTIAFRLP